MARFDWRIALCQTIFSIGKALISPTVQQIHRACGSARTQFLSLLISNVCIVPLHSSKSVRYFGSQTFGIIAKIVFAKRCVEVERSDPKNGYLDHKIKPGP